MSDIYVGKDAFWAFREAITERVSELDKKQVRTEALYESIQRDLSDVRKGQTAMVEGMSQLAQKIEHNHARTTTATQGTQLPSLAQQLPAQIVRAGNGGLLPTMLSLTIALIMGAWKIFG